MIDKVQIAKKFWQDIFNEEPIFLDKYFNNYYKEENLIIDYDKDTFECKYMGLIVEYEYKYFDDTLNVGYLTAIATNTQQRGKGYMRECLERAFSVMRNKGIIISCLIPANEFLRETYARHGFVSCFSDIRLSDRNKSIIHTKQTIQFYKESGYDVENPSVKTKGMMKILDNKQAVMLYNKYHRTNSISEKDYNQEELTKLIFSDSYMDLMFDF